MIKRQVIYADQGKILTDGQSFGMVVYLAENQTAEGWYQIDICEYQRRLQEETTSEVQYG